MLEHGVKCGVQTGIVMSMPVPSSFNDITTDASLQNFVGWVWYDRIFYIANEWKKKRIVLRIDSAHYNAIVVCCVSSVQACAKFISFREMCM